jgi:hypothetical protein
LAGDALLAAKRQGPIVTARAPIASSHPGPFLSSPDKGRPGGVGGFGIPHPLFSAPDARAYFLLLRQKKVAKEKATPALRGRLRRLPCATRAAGRLRNSGLRPSDSARRLPPAPLRCSALHEGDPENHLNTADRGRNMETDGDRSVLPPPWKAPSNAGLSGEVGEHCLRVKPELRSPRSRRVAQGTPPQAGRRPGVAFSLATFFWRSKRKYARASGAEPSARETEKPKTLPASPCQGTRGVYRPPA